MGGDTVRLMIFGLVALAAQVGLAPLLAVGGVRPDILLIFTVGVALRRGAYYGLMTGLLAGVLQDALALGPLGVAAMIKSSLGFWVGYWLQSRDNPVGIAEWSGLVFLASLIHGLTTLLFLYQGTIPAFLRQLVSSPLPAALYTTLIAFLWSLAPAGERMRQPIKAANARSRRGGR